MAIKLKTAKPVKVEIEKKASNLDNLLLYLCLKFKIRHLSMVRKNTVDGTDDKNVPSTIPVMIKDEYGKIRSEKKINKKTMRKFSFVFLLRMRRKRFITCHISN